MKNTSGNKVFLLRILFFFAACLVLLVMYVTCCLCSSYSFKSLLREESPAKIVHCSLDVCSSDNEFAITVDVDSEIFEGLFQVLQAEKYTKPLASVLGFTVSAYHIEAYPFYRILLQHEDNHRTEVIVNGTLLLIGSTTESGLTVYQISNGDSLLNGLNSFFNSFPGINC